MQFQKHTPKKTRYSIHFQPLSTLQTSLTLQKPRNTRDFLDDIANLKSALANLKSQFLAALESDCHDGLLG